MTVSADTHCTRLARLRHWGKRLLNASPGVQTRRSRLGLPLLLALILAGGYGPARAAPKLNVLYSFTNFRGEQPVASLIADGAGNLYGTTQLGGTNNDGVVFELSPPTDGKKAWKEKVLFSFNGTNGNSPQYNLLMDGAGNLYGTTYLGGSDNDGVVFELSPPKAGKKAWTETVLFSFDGADGNEPLAGLIADGAGNLYGTTEIGGSNNYGVVFELSPPKGGKKAWTETVLFSFADGIVGCEPEAGVISDGAGNLYGTTAGCGVNYGGVVFELSPPKKGHTAWTEAVLYAFSLGEEYSPVAPLLTDSAGNLYGTTYVNSVGDNNSGVVFELSPPPKGQTAWTETVLLNFTPGGPNGAGPYAGVIADGAGNLYGTTYYGGVNCNNNANGCGVVFELSPPPKGQTAWTETVLQSFNGTDGYNPIAGVIADGAGNLYGTTQYGGSNNEGVVYKLTP